MILNGLIAALIALNGFVLDETFDYPDGTDGAPTWYAESVDWEIAGGALHAANSAKTFYILEKAPYGTQLTVEATVTVAERAGDNWGIAGVGIRWDARNYWHFALVEAPETHDSRHQVELIEMLDGAWLSQDAEATRLDRIVHTGADFNWAYGHPYRLRLVMTPGKVEGTLSEMDGVERARIAFALSERAVAKGRPMLDNACLDTVFDDVHVTVEGTTPGPEATTTAFPAYVSSGSERITAKASGFFYPKEIDGRAWLIDPAGKAFYMVGTDHASYRVHWCEKLGYAPYSRNMQEQFGSEEKWADSTAERLAAWGFNTLPANHSEKLRYRQFPHIKFQAMGSAFAAIDDICPKTTWTGFPNVFSPRWARHCDKAARRACAPSKDDPWLIGYFLDNELEWFGKSHQAWGLFEEAWKKPADHTAKQAWVAFLADKLASPRQFAEQWGVSVEGFEDLLNHTEPQPPLNDEAKALAEEWVRSIAEEYFRTCREAILRHDPNHLILGCRFAGRAPEIWDIAGKYCDIVSFNMYPRIDVEGGVPAPVIEQIEEWHDKCRRPMMITEWSFPALDSGLPCEHGAGMRVDTQQQRAQCFTHFQTLMFSLPFMVGSNYFMWVDEPALGIASTFPEDTNYGLVNEQNEPYPDLTQAAARLNPRACGIHQKGAMPQPPSGVPLAAKLLQLPEKEVSLEESVLTLKAGGLTLEGPAGGHAWNLSFNGKPLGVFYALIHQKTSQSLWVASDTARITALRQNEDMSVVDMELEREHGGEAVTQVEEGNGAATAQHAQPRRYLSRWRFWVPRNGEEWVGTQCLEVRNTDAGGWTLVEVLHYFRPAIGGDAQGDEPVVRRVPNYYRQGSAWGDEEAGVGVGCWFADTEALTVNYWRDEGGGIHSDLRHAIEAPLAPGEGIALRGEALERPPLAIFFPFKGTTLEAFGAAAGQVRKDAAS